MVLATQHTCRPTSGFADVIWKIKRSDIRRSALRHCWKSGRYIRGLQTVRRKAEVKERGAPSGREVVKLVRLFVIWKEKRLRMAWIRQRLRWWGALCAQPYALSDIIDRRWGSGDCRYVLVV